MLSDRHVDALLIALIDRTWALINDVTNERLCTNNSDTIETLQKERERVEWMIEMIRWERNK